MQQNNCDFLSNYEAWRDYKLSNYPVDPSSLFVDIADITNIKPYERAALLENIKKYNVSLFRTPNTATPDDLTTIGTQFKLGTPDFAPLYTDSKTGVTKIAPQENPGTMPFSHAGLNWHTDGYYLPTGEFVQSYLLYCEQPSEEGGVNAAVDHELFYIYLKEHYPELVDAAFDENAVTFIYFGSANKGPLFSCQQNHLHLRYSRKTKRIEWSQALGRLPEIFDEFIERNEQYILRFKLNRNEGLFSNNIVHNRTRFSSPNRVIYRLRYFNPI